MTLANIHVGSYASVALLTAVVLGVLVWSDNAPKRPRRDERMGPVR